MNELEKIKSTITISLGSKNRLRELKGSASYEEYINYLIRLRNRGIHSGENYIELQKFNRKKGICSIENFKIIFSYNEFNLSPNFVFDISLDAIRENGEKIKFPILLSKIYSDSGNGAGLGDGSGFGHGSGSGQGASDGSAVRKEPLSHAAKRCKLYLELLSVAIRNEIEPLFKHNGRFEDYFSWEQEFNLLNLPRKSFENDVMEQLQEYKQGDVPSSK